ncbi:MAG: hypothetical protein ACI9PU_001658, partial [Ascidiaceihabitans sp.]
MGRGIFTVDRRKCPSQEAPNSSFLADALSGHCSAMPCRVRDETYIKVKGSGRTITEQSTSLAKPLISCSLGT